MAYFKIEPFGPFAQNYDSARLLSMIHQFMLMFAKGKHVTLKPEALMLGSSSIGQQKEQTLEEQLAMVKMIASTLGEKK